MIDGILIYEGSKPLLLFPIGGADAHQFQRQIAGCPPAKQSEDWQAPVLVSASQAMHIKQKHDLFFIAPFATNASPLLAENLVNQVVQVLESYFRTPITPQLVTEKSAEIMLILSEMMDTGVPRITEPNIIEHLLYKDGLLAQLFAQAANPAAVAQATLNNSTPGTQSVPDKLVPWEMPWRKPRVKHMKEELFVDIIENVRCVRKQNNYQKATNLQVRGEIMVTSRLNETPTVTLDLNLPVRDTQLQLHRCVDQQYLAVRTRSDPFHKLAFCPPDERSCIARYSMVTKDPGLLSVGLIRRRDLFEIALSTSIDIKVEHIEDLVVAIHFPPQTRSVKELSSTGGDLDVSSPQCCVYHLGKTVPMGWKAQLKAQGLGPDGQTVAPLYLDLRYRLVGKVASSVAVKSIGIPPARARNAAPPFKGVRYQTKVESYIVA